MFFVAKKQCFLTRSLGEGFITKAAHSLRTRRGSDWYQAGDVNLEADNPLVVAQNNYQLNHKGEQKADLFTLHLHNSQEQTEESQKLWEIEKQIPQCLKLWQSVNAQPRLQPTKPLLGGKPTMETANTAIPLFL